MESMSDAPEEAVPTGESEPIGEPVADSAADLGAPADDASRAAEPTSELPAEPAEPAEELADSPAGFRWPRGLQATATRRALLLTALGGLLIAGLVTAIPAVGTGPGRLAGYIDSDPVPSTGTRSNAAFNHAASGDCLMWPDGNPDAASIVKCADDHRFEVAESLDMRTFPGSEYGPSAAPPSPARIQQITQEQCEAAVRQYMGTKFDPNSKFSVSLLWSGDRAWRQSGDRRMLCGLQQPGPNNQQTAFKGKVADIDQSKVWPAGTCLGIDSATNQPIDVPVDCAAPHAMEVTGTVNLAEKSPTALPAGTGAGRVHQGLVHQDDRRLPRARQAAHHHPDADLSHRVAAELGGGQSRGRVQYRRDTGQRGLGHLGEQRQGTAADQRSTAGATA